LLVTRVDEVADLDASGAKVIEGDRTEPLTVAESVQAVPSTGLIDEE
jgi:hypothetical protein